jgi:hypothetical protein
MTRASGLRLSSSLASGSTGIQIVMVYSPIVGPSVGYARSVLRPHPESARSAGAKIRLMPRCPIS